jgi:hypothetical protein
MSRFDICAEPKASRVKSSPKKHATAKQPAAPGDKTKMPRITAAMAARWVRRGRTYNP